MVTMYACVKGQGIEVTSEGRESEKERGSERDHKEKTPVAADDEEKRANSPSDNVGTHTKEREGELIHENKCSK